MKSLSLDQMAVIEGGRSPYCRASLDLLSLACALGSHILIIVARLGVKRYCKGFGGGGDSIVD